MTREEALKQWKIYLTQKRYARKFLNGDPVITEHLQMLEILDAIIDPKEESKPTNESQISNQDISTKSDIKLYHSDANNKIYQPSVSKSEESETQNKLPSEILRDEIARKWAERERLYALSKVEDDGWKPWPPLRNEIQGDQCVIKLDKSGFIKEWKQI